MQFEITAPKKICAEINPPPSKSLSNRALIISTLAQGNILPENISDCDDTRVMLHALGEKPAIVDVCAAGTAMRFLTSYFALTKGEHIITGTERMKQRPIGALVDALRHLGAIISYVDSPGYPPLHIVGKELDGGLLDIAGNISSQYISSLLMIAPKMRQGLTLHMKGNVISRPYIDMTLWLMREYGAKVEWEDTNTIKVYPQPYKPKSYCVESDWSAASYWYETVALAQPGSEIILSGLDDNSKQGDSSVRYIFSLLGVKTEFLREQPDFANSRQEHRIENRSKVKLTCTAHRVARLEYDFINSPDLAQTFIACCPLLGIPFRFTGLQTLRIKETDRIEAMKREMEKLGFVLEEQNKCELSWDGKRSHRSMSAIETYKDHRMAMALAPLAIRLGMIKMNDPMVVKKSYPEFWNDLKKVGFTIQSIDEVDAGN